MFILRAIGNFFARIGRWIRDTAWVQPLLIVGAIFGLIFSIPHLIDWVQSWFTQGVESERFYSTYQYSLNNAQDGNSQVDKLFEAIKDGTANEFVGADKFFLSFVKEDCAICEDQYEGYKLLTSNWGKGEFADLKGEKFKIVTIYIDSEKEINGEDENLFKYCWENHSYLFEQFTENYENSEYAQFKGYTSGCTAFTNLFDPDADGNFKIETPSTFFFDFSGSTEWSWEGNNIEGLSEIMFSIPGDDGFDRARVLHDCWLHKGVFADHEFKY